MEGRKEGREEMFYLRIYMVSDIWSGTIQIMKKGNPMLPLHGLFFLISSKGSFINIIPDRTVYTTTFVTQFWSTGLLTQQIFYHGAMYTDVCRLWLYKQKQ